jgi:hypothetical protein
MCLRFFKYLISSHSSNLSNNQTINNQSNKQQRQVVAYLSQRFEEIPTFPRFYLNEHHWYRLRLKKRRITMLSVG